MHTAQPQIADTTIQLFRLSLKTFLGALIIALLIWPRLLETSV